MTNIAILNKELHRTLRVEPTGGEAKHFVPVIAAEFLLLATHYPILFSKDSETGAFYCGAMLGFEPGENLFEDEDVYRPLNLRRGPFYASDKELAIDLDHPRVGSGQPLFAESGEPSDYLKSIIALFGDLMPGLERTRIFIATLLEHKLIEGIDINLSFDDGSKRALQGLYTVNLETVRSLPDAVALDLFRRGYLQLIYTMAASLQQVPVMAKKKNRRFLKGAAALENVLG